MYTIIIPVYNAEKTIRQCLESILCQSNKDFELILINDGSIDTSGDICNEYASKDSRIKVFHKPNGGVSSARNLGLEHAKGEWITFIDADDYIDQNYLPDDDNCKSDLLIQNWKNQGTNEIIEYIPKQNINLNDKIEFINEHLHKYIFRCPWAKFYKHNIIEKNDIKFDKRFSIGEDSLFVYDYLYHCHSIKIIGSSYYMYKRNEEQHKYKENIETTLAYIKEFWVKYKKLNCKNKKLLEIKYNFYRSITENIDSESNTKKWNSNEYTLKLWDAIYLSTIKDYFIYIKWRIICKIKKIMSI